MAYQSKHTGINIDAGIDINDTQNNRLNALENKDVDLENIEMPDIKLNYSLIGSTTQPSNPIENTIWVNTDQEITKHVFSKMPPLNPINNMLWIRVDDNSNIILNRLVLNNVEVDTVYPLSTKQYISNEWIDIDVMCYQNNQWNTWWNGELYKNGDEFSSVTGGWHARAWSGSYDSIRYGEAPELIKNATNMTIKHSAATSGRVKDGAIELLKDIDLTDWSYIQINYDYLIKSTTSSSVTIQPYLSAVDRYASYWLTNAAKYKILSSGSHVVSEEKKNQIATLDVSNLTGNYDIVIGITSSHSIATIQIVIYEIKMYK